MQDIVHITGSNESDVTANFGYDTIISTQSSQANNAPNVVGITSIEVGSSPDDLAAISIDDGKQKLKLNTDGTEIEVLGQLIQQANIEGNRAELSILTSGYVVSAIANKMGEKYSASNMGDDLYIKISGATEQQLRNETGDRIKSFMINDDDYLLYRMTYKFFRQQVFANIKKGNIGSIILGVDNIETVAYSVGFCIDDDAANKAIVQYNHSAS